MSRLSPLPRSAYRWWMRLQTRWADNDAYGHVNNSVYYQWFDTAVNNWLIEQGLLDIQGGDPIGLVVETGCTYSAPLSYPQDVDIGLFVSRLGSSSVTYRIGVFPADGVDAAAQGHFTHVCVARQTHRPTPLPSHWRARMETIVAPSPGPIEASR